MSAAKINPFVPSGLCDDHLRPDVVEPPPEVHVLQGDLDVGVLGPRDSGTLTQVG